MRTRSRATMKSRFTNRSIGRARMASAMSTTFTTVQPRARSSSCACVVSRAGLEAAVHDHLDVAAGSEDLREPLVEERLFA